jgi:hypothetical protein
VIWDVRPTNQQSVDEVKFFSESLMDQDFHLETGFDELSQEYEFMIFLRCNFLNVL